MSKVIGIIVEYNPFHNGHKYHLEQAKKKSDDILVAVMSGDFVQRGEPAFIDKLSRTKMALENSVDIVAELPSFYSAQSAEIFALGAVKILKNFGVDEIVFGSESGDLENMEKIAELEESTEFKKALKRELDLGQSYPLSFSNAKKSMMDDFDIKSNDILGIEYLKAIKKNQNSKIKVRVIKRIEVGYNDNYFKNGIASATGIRQKIFETQKINNVREYLPENSFNILNNMESFAKLKDFYELIRYQILNNFDSLKNIQDIEEGIENRIYNCAKKFSEYEEFFEELKTKRYTVGRLQRILIHILLGLTKEITKEVKKDIPYIRVLGFNKKGQKYLREILSNEKEFIDKTKIITSFRGIKKILSEEEIKFFEYNEKNSIIYRLVTNYEDQKKPIIFD
ncbi:MAG: nucleotidyltransferase [Fusobacteriaceae bacterium]